MKFNGKLLMIVNPKAGKAHSRSALFTLVDTFCRGGYEVTVFTTGKGGDARELAKEAADQYDLIVCCGGDGTLNEVIDGMVSVDIKKPIGYIPMGSTNDFASTLKISSDPKTAAIAVLSGKDDPMDVGSFNGRHFIYIASFGAFTAASYTAPQAVKNVIGHLAYVLAGIKELSSIRTYHVIVEADDRKVEGDYLFGAVCNSTSVGGLVKLDKGLVDMSDGLFETILVKKPRSIADFNRLVTCLNTSRFDEDLFEFFDASKITFTMEDNVPWTLDGEYEAGTPVVTIENRPRAFILRH